MGITIEKAREELTAAGIKWTRQDMMNHAVEYAEYMDQFVTDATVQMVENAFGPQIATSTDEYFNDIPLAKWDRLAGFDRYLKGRSVVPGIRMIALANMFTQAPENAVPSISPSDSVGVLKAAARRIRARAK